MGWFGKSNHQKEADAALFVLGNFWDCSMHGKAGAPAVLSFELPESHFRYHIFCISVVQCFCGWKMKKPDSIQTVLLDRFISLSILSDPTQFQNGGAVDSKQVSNFACKYLKHYQMYWKIFSATIGLPDVEQSKLAQIEALILMLRFTESDERITDRDRQRLEPLATWIRMAVASMPEAFSDIVRMDR